MKLLDQITSIFNTTQRRLLEDFLAKKVASGLIQWKEIFAEHYKRRVGRLMDGLQLARVPAGNAIDSRTLAEQLEDIEITLLSLAAESELINTTLHRHEMFRKDNVKIFFNVAQGYTDMINNEVKDYKTNNVTIENGSIEMMPSTIMDFKIKSVESTYAPDSMLDRSGNDPTPENIIPGTDRDYWLTEILTSRRTPVSATVTLGFNGFIKFNILQFATAGKFTLHISKVEIKSGSSWIERPFSGEYSGKYIQLTALDGNNLPTSYSTEYVRVTFQQNKPEYLWSRKITNEREILIDPVAEKTSTVNDYMYKDIFALARETTATNVFSYVFGLYYARVLLKTYSGNEIGNFYSRKFTAANGFEFLTIESTEYKPEPFTIEYRIIQHDGSYANTSTNSVQVLPNTKIHLLDTFRESKTVTGVASNTIPLDHALLKTGFECFINGTQVRPVDNFDEANDYQVIIIGKYLYLNKPLQMTDTIRVSYQHRTDYVIIQITLKTNTVYQSPNCPKILDFNVRLS